MHLLRKSKIFERMSVPDEPSLLIVDLMKDTNRLNENVNSTCKLKFHTED